MMENKQDQIDQYINKEMSASDRQVFEEEMMKDAALKAEVEEQEMLARGIRVGARQEIEKMLTVVQHDFRQIKKKEVVKLRRLRVGLLIAASISLLLVVGSILLQKKESSSTPVAQTEINNPPDKIDEPIAGLSRVVRRFQVERIRKNVQAETSAWNNRGESISVLIYRHSLDEDLYLLSENQLQIFSAEPEKYEETDLVFLELVDKNETNLFLKNDTTFYALNAALSSREPLIPVLEKRFLEELK